MYQNKIIPVLHLQLFADGGAAGGGGAGDGAGTGVTAPAAGVQTTGVKSNPQAADGTPAAEVQKTEPAVVDRKAEFDRMIKGDYKDLYDSKVQEIVQRRLKGPSEAAEKYRALTPTLELLAKHYGVEDPADIKALTAAIEADDSLIEKLAMEKNMTPDEYRRIQKVERENAKLKREVAERQQKEAAAKQYQIWMNQAEQAKNFYPSLNLDAELTNPVFRDLIKNPIISIQTAYEIIHKDEITAGLLRHATEQASKQVAASVAANGARPAENGSGAQSPATVKLDPSKMTKAQRQDFRRRAAMGEKISF